MPINPSGMVMKLDPVQGLDLTGFSRAMEHQQQLQQERERLRMMREQMQEQQRYHAEQSELRKMEEQGAMARQQLQLQQQREKAEADRLAALTQQRQAAQAQARKYLDDRDFEGVESLFPEMNELGMLAERQGQDAEGNPVYRIEQDRAAAEKAEAEQLAQTQTYGENETAEQSLSRLEAMGLPEGRGNLDDPAADRAPLPTDEMLMAEPSPDGIDAETAKAYDPLTEQRARERDMLRPSSEVYGGAPRGLGPAMLSSGDAYAQALGASEYARQTGQPLKGPDVPDEMGAVPSNTYDTGAMKSQAVRRLSPALQALVDAQPEAYKGSTESTNAAVAELALAGVKGLEMADKLRAGPDANIRSELAAAREAEKAQAEAEKPLTRPQLQGLEAAGWQIGEGISKERGLPDIYKNAKRAEMIRSVLTDDIPGNDMSIAFQLTDLLGSRGTQSNNDLRVALGLDAESTIDQVRQKLHGWFIGGNREERVKTLLSLVDASVGEDDQTVFAFVDDLDKQIAAAQDPEVRRGLEKYRLTVPEEYLDVEEEPEEGGARRGQTVVSDAEGNVRQPTAGGMDDDDEFMDALHTAADEADLDVDAILPLISAESGGDPSVQNKQGSSARGLIQFLDSTARDYGFKDSKEFAQLSRAEQAPYIVRYLKDKGVTSEHDQGDIYVAIAAPAALNEGDDFKVYKRGTPEYDLNQTWDLENDGVITRGEIYRWGMGERRKEGAAPKAKGQAPAPGGNVLKRLSPTGGAAEAATEKSRSDSEIDDLTAD